MGRVRGGMLALVLIGLAGPASGETPPDATLRFDFRHAPLPQVIEEIARATGTRVLFDPDLRANVTLSLATPVRRDEALEILHAVLLHAGFAMVPGPDGVQRVLSIGDARTRAPFVRAEDVPESDRAIVTLVRLEASDATELARVLDPRSQVGTVVFPWVPTNSLILAGAESRVRRMLALISALDRAGAVDLRVVPLRWANAVAAADQLGAAFPPDAIPPVPQTILPDERTNSVVLEAPPARLAAMQRFLTALDTPAAGRGDVHVIHVKNADAEALAEALVAIAGDEGSALPADSFRVVADPPTNSVVVAADADVFSVIANMIGELDRVPRHAAIDVAVMQLDHSKDVSLGFDAIFPILVPDEVGDPLALGKIGDALRFAGDPPSGLPFIARIARSPILIPIIGPGGIPIELLIPTIAAQITASEERAQLTLLQQPHLIAATGEEQRIFVGQQVPVPVTTTQVGAQAQVPTDDFVTEASIERRDVGVDLRVRPVVLSDRVVELELEIRLSALAQTAGSLQLGPTLDEAEVQAKIRLWDGAIALLAATPREDVIATESGVPFLRDIPILGWAFKSVRDQHIVRRVVFAVQATIVDAPTDLAAEAIRRRLAFERELDRTRPLAALTDAPYALLVASFAVRSDAERVLPELAGLPGIPQVVEWTEAGKPRFDVYLVGLDRIAETGPPAVALREKGFRPTLAVIPELLR